VVGVHAQELRLVDVVFDACNSKSSSMPLS